ATIIRAYDEPTALLLLNSAQFAAVLILTSLHTQTYPALTKALVSYATEKGGTVIAGFMFPSFMNMTQFKQFFKQFGKNWTGGSYERRDFIRNDEDKSKQGQSSPTAIQELGRRTVDPLPKTYSMKALHANGVTREEAIYLNERFRKPTKNEGELEAPIAFASVGKGWLGYLGDVNIEGPTQLVAKAMLGLHGNN
ncbi:3153_t:CDS:1, partial [Acaulospora colombiana]